MNEKDPKKEVPFFTGDWVIDRNNPCTAVEQAATIGLFGYEAVKSLLSGPPEPSWRHL